ncbi:MAG: C-GCAxxG-C-C family protein [Candidatus Bathyarchaeota archaeon]|nr:C-GCAxxG-C-C family protein [Candidatus Bathyarchaeota archaeon]
MRQRNTSLPEKAGAYFKQGYNCTQSVLLAMQEHYKLENELIPKIATAFGGRNRKMRLTMRSPNRRHNGNQNKTWNQPANPENREKAYTLAQKFYEQFVKECGSTYCRELIGYDLTNLEDLEKARKLNVFDKK